MDIIHKTDANTDIYADRPDSSDQAQDGRPGEGVTKLRQNDLSGFELAAANTDKHTEDWQFSYDAGLSGPGFGGCYPKHFETDWWDRSI